MSRDFAREHVLLTDSGTEALVLALHAARELAGPESPVALPAYTCFDVAAAAVAVGAPIHLYDLDPETLGPDWDSLTRVLEGGARVVVIAPLAGIPVDWDLVVERVTAFGAAAVEDAAQGHGAEWRGRPLGSLGDVSVLSFGRGKGWTGGAGGALLCAHEALAVAARREVRRHGTLGRELVAPLLALAQSVFGRPALYGLPAAIPWLGLGDTRYRAARVPGPMSRSAAALLEATRDGARRAAATRRENGKWLVAHVPRGSRVSAVRQPFGSEPGYLRFPVRL
ncbi:MAG TPA: DegT/DnrJ/EryC1/StrS family aminotransferase, partial [Methylomirabilota bacterium]|nr:DegT/DnrJ/EryC1/StrS family aminotransferase [Methylomirabilota bacterium]